MHPASLRQFLPRHQHHSRRAYMNQSPNRWRTLMGRLPQIRFAHPIGVSNTIRNLDYDTPAINSYRLLQTHRRQPTYHLKTWFRQAQVSKIKCPARYIRISYCLIYIKYARATTGMNSATKNPPFGGNVFMDTGPIVLTHFGRHYLQIRLFRAATRLCTCN